MIENGWIVARTGQRVDQLVPLKSIRLLGEHLVDDVMAAATVASIVGARPDAMTAAVETFAGSSTRWSWWRSSRASGSSTTRRRPTSKPPFDRSRAFERRRRDYRRTVQGRRPSAAADADWRARQGGGGHRRSAGPGATGARRRHRRCATRIDGGSGRMAFEIARPSGVVLLAPACSSFDMFRDYAERGERSRTRCAGSRRVGSRTSGKSRNERRAGACPRAMCER